MKTTRQIDAASIPKRFLTYAFLFTAIGFTLYLALLFQQRNMLYSSTAAIWFSAACSGALFLSSIAKKGTLDRSISIISFFIPLLLATWGFYSLFLFYSILLVVTAGRSFYANREILSRRPLLFQLALTGLLAFGCWIIQAFLSILVEGTLHLSVLRQMSYLLLFLGVFYLILLLSSLMWRILLALRLLTASNVPAPWVIVVRSWMNALSIALAMFFVFILKTQYLKLGSPYPNDTLHTYYFQTSEVVFFEFMDLVLVVGLAVFLFIRPLIIAYRFSRSPGMKRFLYIGTCSILLLTIFSMFIPDPRQNDFIGSWYERLLRLRGEHLPTNSPIVIITFQSGWPEKSQFLDFVSLLDKSNPKVIAFPTPRSLGFVERYFGIDSALHSMVKNAALILNGEEMENIPVGPSAEKIRTRIEFNLNTSLRTTYFQEQFPVSYMPLSYNLIDFGVMTALAARTRGVRDIRSIITLKNLENLNLPTGRSQTVFINYYRPQTKFQSYRLSDQPFTYAWYGEIYNKDSAEPFFQLGTESFAINKRERKFQKQTWRTDEKGDFGYMLSQPVETITDLKDKIILIEAAGENLTTRNMLRHSPGFIYASIIQNILQNEFIIEGSRWQHLLGAVVIIMLCVLLFLRLKPWVALGTVFVLGAVSYGILALLFIEARLFLYPTPFIFLFVGCCTLFFPYEIIVERRRMFEEQARLSQELRTAHDMQMDLMPKEDPLIKGFDISGACIPASEVGGDFYDYVWLDQKKTKLGIALADVSGKAMKAAMTAVMTSGMLYSEAAKSKSPREILARINRPLYLRSDRRVFTALSFAVLDTKSKKLTYSSAGQSQPILVRGGVLSYLKTEGVRLPLGIKEELKYRDFHLKLASGDTIVFYTDGVPEAMNTESKFYGFERFEDLLKQHQSLGAKELRDKIVENVQLFAGKTEQPDDMTVVVVKVN